MKDSFPNSSFTSQLETHPSAGSPREPGADLKPSFYRMEKGLLKVTCHREPVCALFTVSQLRRATLWTLSTVTLNNAAPSRSHTFSE